MRIGVRGGRKKLVEQVVEMIIFYEKCENVDVDVDGRMGEERMGEWSSGHAVAGHAHFYAD